MPGMYSRKDMPDSLLCTGYKNKIIKTMGKTLSFIFHIAAMILLIISTYRDDFIHIAIMAECIAIYFKLWDDYDRKK